MNTWPLEYYARTVWSWAGLGDVTWTLCLTGGLILVMAAAMAVWRKLERNYEKKSGS